MSPYLFHGSLNTDITELSASSLLHGTADTYVLYLTSQFPYALFYIWDKAHTLRSAKHITSWVKDGIVYYEEQFPDQLAKFYKGVSGCVYAVEKSPQFTPIDTHESIWYAKSSVAVAHVYAIPDVYDEILRYEREGQLRIIRFADVDKERIRALHRHLAEKIVNHRLLEQPSVEDAVFYRTFFTEAWGQARDMYAASSFQRERQV